MNTNEMKKDYICRQDLLMELSAGCMPINEKNVSGVTGDNDCIADYINNAPAENVQEVVHGKWLNFTGDFSTAECAECGEIYEVSDYANKEHFELFCSVYKFCPNCGAKMDGNKSDILPETYKQKLKNSFVERRTL